MNEKIQNIEILLEITETVERFLNILGGCLPIWGLKHSKMNFTIQNIETIDGFLKILWDSWRILANSGLETFENGRK